MKNSLFIFFGFFFLFLGAQEKENITVHKILQLMGSRFEITVIAPNEEIGFINIDEATAEIKRIDKLISSLDPESETSLINNNAGIKPVKVSTEVFMLLERAKQISEITDGAFDVTYASMEVVWKFDGSMDYLPTDEAIKNSISKVGYQNMILDPLTSTVFLKKKGMKIGLEAMGKGYVADKAKAFLISRQVPGGIINAGGDLSTWGTKITGEKWLIGVANPLNKEKMFSWLPVVESSVATSGNYEKFIVFEGKKFSHIIDPRTGYPTSGINSVTVFAKSSELCDALATAVFIMGIDKGISLINQLGGTEVIIVDADNKFHKSAGILFDSDP